jgi:hypothetical protein
MCVSKEEGGRERQKSHPREEFLRVVEEVKAKVEDGGGYGLPVDEQI